MLIVISLNALAQAPASKLADEKREVQFISFVLDEAQKAWDTLLPQQTNSRYQHAKTNPPSPISSNTPLAGSAVTTFT